MNEQARHAGAKPSVIVVDDDEGVRRSLGLLLRTNGYKVVTHAGGAEMLAAPPPGSSDVLLVDYVMPPMDGLTLVARLRERNWQGSAVLITGRYDTTLPDRAVLAGITTILEKPLDRAEVLRALDKAG